MGIMPDPGSAVKGDTYTAIGINDVLPRIKIIRKVLQPSVSPDTGSDEDRLTVGNVTTGGQRYSGAI